MGQVGLDSTCAQTHVGTPLSDAAPKRPLRKSSTNHPIEIDLSAYAHLPRLMTPRRVEQESSLSKGTIRRAIQSGRLKSVKPTPRSRRIPVECFAAWIEWMKAEASHDDALAVG